MTYTLLRLYRPPAAIHRACDSWPDAAVLPSPARNAKPKPPAGATRKRRGRRPRARRERTSPPAGPVDPHSFADRQQPRPAREAIDRADPGRRPRGAARLRARIRRAGRGRRRRSRHPVRRRPQAGPLAHQRRTQRGQHGGLHAQVADGPCRAGGHGLRTDHHEIHGHDGQRGGRRKSDQQHHARGLRRDRPQPPHRAARDCPGHARQGPARCSR